MFDKAATDAGAKRLALMHLARFADAAAVQADAEVSYAGEVTVPVDGDTLAV